MPLSLTEQQRKDILLKIKNNIEKEGNCRVGWAIRQITKEEKYERSPHIIEKIANTIIQSNEYIKEPSKQSPIDFNILRNPQYKKETWINKHPIMFEVLKSFITAVFAIIVSVILSILIIGKPVNQKEVQEYEQEVNQSSLDSVSSTILKNENP